MFNLAALSLGRIIACAICRSLHAIADTRITHWWNMTGSFAQVTIQVFAACKAISVWVNKYATIQLLLELITADTTLVSVQYDTH